METLVQVLAVLFKAKFLVSEEDGEMDEADIQPATLVKLFLNYKKYAQQNLWIYSIQLTFWVE